MVISGGLQREGEISLRRPLCGSRRGALRAPLRSPFGCFEMKTGRVGEVGGFRAGTGQLATGWRA